MLLIRPTFLFTSVTHQVDEWRKQEDPKTSPSLRVGLTEWLCYSQSSKVLARDQQKERKECLRYHVCVCVCVRACVYVTFQLVHGFSWNLVCSFNASPLFIIAESSSLRTQMLVDFNPGGKSMLATLVKNWVLETLNRHFSAIEKLKFYFLPQSTHSLTQSPVWIIETNWLIVFGEITALHSVNQTGPINTICGQSAVLLIL